MIGMTVPTGRGLMGEAGAIWRDAPSISNQASRLATVLLAASDAVIAAFSKGFAARTARSEVLL
ncbi:hypothetical protein JANAI62_23140 [Jannaschia pagri]|uniref:Uncharacterized protein n=1 Tax=Jannaschia pagri TaxID=2829797 RepID=A0ABQ4NMR9_9RHOB|nr:MULTISPECIES: hypothetical protein [unclassified Jannaschia]GIT91857.1 hypothetical protein JANAI61_23150 [Jannaschia sp. AI_61]GIT95691.1 hypothetical protein JANAI62_23140 [Jannaschia sp. AI_62]